MSKHTPTPWHLDNYEHISDCKGDNILNINDLQQDTDADSAFIVRACNAHERLVEALEILRDTIQCNAEETAIALKRAEAALATARGAGSEDE